MVLRLFLFFFFMTSNSALANERTFGVGFAIGVPTGFTVRHERQHGTSWDFLAGWSAGLYNPKFLIQGNYLINFDRTLKLDTKALEPYFGIGARGFSHKSNTYLGVRTPLGLRTFWSPRGYKIETFAETGLVFYFVPETNFGLDLSIGGRFYF